MRDDDTAWLEAALLEGTSDDERAHGLAALRRLDDTGQPWPGSERMWPEDILARLWTEHVNRPGPPPTWKALAAFASPEDVRREAGRLMNAIWPTARGIREFRHLVSLELGHMIVFDVDLRYAIRGMEPRAMHFAVSLEEMRDRYTEAGLREPFPLTPVLTAFPVPIEPTRHPRPIVPRAFVTDRPPPRFHLPAPNTPGAVAPQPAYLPGLEPEAPPLPALVLMLFDEAGGASLTQNGRVSAEAAIFLEAVLNVPPKARDGRLREMRYAIREIAGDWLGWDLNHYRRTGKYTGQALARAVRGVRDLWVPMNDRGGGYFPVMVSAWQGFGLDDHIAFVVRLPPGKVGPQVDRALLRSLRGSGPAYRLYLSLCFEWDKYGGHNGRLIRPTRPEVQRAPGGQIVNARGRILTDPGGRPVYTPHDPRAIPTGRREPNDARAAYRWYSPDDLVSMAYPLQVFADRKRRYEARVRAVNALRHLERAGVVVEDEGTPRSPRWRVMPPDPDAREALGLPSV